MCQPAKDLHSPLRMSFRPLRVSLKGIWDHGVFHRLAEFLRATDVSITLLPIALCRRTSMSLVTPRCICVLRTV